jgi:3-hydroxyisobutyrate dehydrogenase-like beta-hydroxyacid dehydrogenase
MANGRIGFVGLGNMGRPMATNMVAAGHDLVVFDTAGTAERAPGGATVAASVGDVAAVAETVILSLPDGTVVGAVGEEMIEVNERRVTAVVDTSTIGIEAAERVAGGLKRSEIEYVDAPVSGGTAGAAAATIAVMVAASEATYARLAPVLAGLSRNVFHVGTTPGQGQAMKLLNNFLSATAMSATSEAIAFGVTRGLDMGVMVDVLNASSGQNTATSDKFPNRIMPEAYDAGFTNTLLAKDVTLYLEALAEAGTADEVSKTVVGLIRRFAEVEPGADFTRLYPFVRDRR